MDELSDDDKAALNQVSEWVKLWAQRQRNDGAELRAMWHPPKAAGMGDASSNYMAAEDDGENAYEAFLARQLELVDAAIEDLATGPHWAWWAIMKVHGLGHGGVWRYERLAPGGIVPPGLYTNALLELRPALREKGLLID